MLRILNLMKLCKRANWKLDASGKGMCHAGRTACQLRHGSDLRRVIKTNRFLWLYRCIFKSGLELRLPRRGGEGNDVCSA